MSVYKKRQLSRDVPPRVAQQCPEFPFKRWFRQANCLCLCCFSLLNKLSWSCVFMMEHSEGRAYLCCWSVKGSTRHISNVWLSNTFKQTSSFEGSFGWIVLMPHKEYNVVLEIFLVILTVERMQFQSGLLQSKKAIYLQSCCGTTSTLICIYVQMSKV